MAPKKAKKISLNEFLGDSGSWADEMDSLPNAPAVRTEEEQARSNDRYGRRDDFLAPRPDRGGPPRDDIPVPTQPPYTVFIGNLAFDLTEMELEEFFGPSKTKSVKIIRDREDKPKGFGYIEFEELDGLKEALVKSGSSLSGRTIRVSVAEPPKERGGFSGSFDDDAKFDSPWRRDGPLPDLHDSRESSRRRFDGPPGERPSLPSVAEGISDWRSSKPSRPAAPESEAPTFKRKGSGFSTPEGVGAADKEELWAKGSKFVPAPTSSEERFGSMRGKGDMGPPKEPVTEESDWRSARSRTTNVSPSSSTPPTPQINRRKLELLPRSGNASASPSPLSSPKMGPTPPVTVNTSKASPFGGARPVDVTPREKEATERVDKDREVIKERLTMSRTNSRTASERSPLVGARTPPGSSGTHTPASPKPAYVQPKGPNPALAPSVRPTLSFANAARKDATLAERKAEEISSDDSKNKSVEEVTEKTGDITL
ncbi:hypothetical protein BDZ94DRAFT_1275903 [Collybia nuda]|uniref:RRM domain-containing protein n=1 Tax=Collybia nuda TaxID=64659 RepID=A0A9P5XV88_9AGAR|nr:hypothetical protein BDZ94DRAFT_1275903 [Collybia nuda]